MPRTALPPSFFLCAGVAAPAFAADLDNFVPVTDAMIEQPAPATGSVGDARRTAGPTAR